ncbi:carbamoyl-phosphate synthase L chain, ATP binding domain-containing protein [Hyaloraphidium curvatum]|nr:carbamoyl-phosphate synthase L chain, ATP binding domain-containing protein [Hyaloraphidium curvatum]
MPGSSLLRSAAAAARAAPRLPRSARPALRSYATAEPVKDYGKTFDKILIANRGEIACRVIKTARKMGIKTVAVYSDADANSVHVQMADEAVRVGPPPTSQSYLVMDNILGAIKSTGAQAVHPGYGFLSENSHFVEACEREGVTFIGPNTKAMADMGDKIQSKIIAKKAKVNTIPGFDGVVENLDHALSIAKEIGYPVMIKASAGGGGKGMRIAWNEADAKEAFRLAKAEALSSFGDDRLLVEKFIVEPRHIEIQIIGDKHGNTFYLPERECSVQRRNQKVIEEAPSMFIDDATRKAMGEQAVSLAKNVGYYSAGTVEMLVDANRNFYFLEMNTRLQVEHPITEQITGFDLVELMIRVAANQVLPFKQSDVGIKGWALESRVYAEDPERYLPSIGRLNRYIEPKLQPGFSSEAVVRNDSGIREGSEISMYYDPMICKLITHGKDRTEAIDIMKQALDSYVIKGVTHNIPLLRDVLTNQRFVSGKYSTKLLPEDYPEGFKGLKMNADHWTDLLAVSALVHARRDARDKTWIQGGGQTVIPEAWEVFVSTKGEEKKLSITKKGDAYEVSVDGAEPVTVSADWAVESPLIKVKLTTSKGERQFFAQYLDALPVGFRLGYQGSKFDVAVKTPRQEELSKFMKERAKIDTSKVVLSPMPGTVVSLSVKEGDVVIEGAEIAVVEAMKMQNVLRSSRSGKIAKINVKVGDSVAADEILVEFAAGDVSAKDLPKK